MKNKRGDLLKGTVIQLIMLALIITGFLMVNAEKVNSRGVKQQIIEKQLALLIDSATPTTNYTMNKLNLNGYVESIKITNGKIYATIDGLPSRKGYPYFSPYPVRVEQDDKTITIMIGPIGEPTT